jgi:hypothetical protein
MKMRTHLKHIGLLSALILATSVTAQEKSGYSKNTH